MTVTAEYYSENWGGWTDSDELTAALKRAELIVDREIFPSGYTVATTPKVWRTAAQNAVCAQAEFILENGGVSALSETTDGGSVTLGKFSYSGGGSPLAGVQAIPAVRRRIRCAPRLWRCWSRPDCSTEG